MVNSGSWAPAARTPVLADNELHVWRASLSLPTAVLNQLESTLNAQERQRAERFLVPRAREHYVAGRGILRDILGKYLGIEADKIELNYGEQGKPSLAREHKSEIRFNVSHSDGMGLFVFASGHEVGADIEQVRTGVRGLEIASHFFSEEEVAGLAKLPPELVEEGFFGCWTKKEAYVKAHGLGLSIPLRSFSMGLRESKQLLRDEDGRRWSCYAVDLTTGFAGAVVAEGENWNLKYWEWSKQ